MLTVVLSAAVVLAGALIWLSARSVKGPDTMPDTTPGTALESTPPVAVVEAGTALGRADAPVKVEIFSDFQCSHCRRAAEETVAPLVRDYAATGRVQVIYRFFPRLGSESQRAALAAACAADQGLFRAFHDTLFANWRGVQQGAFSAERLRTFADELKLDTTAWSQCVLSQAPARRVAADVADGERRGIRGTPTFFVTAGQKSTKIERAVPYADLRRVVDAALGQ